MKEFSAQGGKVIYVVQSNDIGEGYDPVWAGSSSHEALLAASRMKACRIKIFKNGERYVVEEPPTNG